MELAQEKVSEQETMSDIRSTILDTVLGGVDGGGVDGYSFTAVMIGPRDGPQEDGCFHEEICIVGIKTMEEAHKVAGDVMSLIHDGVGGDPHWKLEAISADVRRHDVGDLFRAVIQAKLSVVES